MYTQNKNIDLEIRNLILKFEKRYDPFRYQIKGICIWPIFRPLISENLKTNKALYNRRPPPKEQTRLLKLTKLLFIILKETIKFIRCYFNKKKN